MQLKVFFSVLFLSTLSFGVEVTSPAIEENPNWIFLTPKPILERWKTTLAQWKQRDEFAVLCPLRYVYDKETDELVLNNLYGATTNAAVGCTSVTLSQVLEFYKSSGLKSAKTRSYGFLDEVKEHYIKNGEDYGYLSCAPSIWKTIRHVNLTVGPSTYDWENPANLMSTRARVAADATVLLGSFQTTSGTAAYTGGIPYVLKNDYGYYSSIYVSPSGVSMDTFLSHFVYPSLWAGQPVPLALSNHQVIAGALAYDPQNDKYYTYIYFGDAGSVSLNTNNGWYDLSRGIGNFSIISAVSLISPTGPKIIPFCGFVRDKNARACRNYKVVHDEKINNTSDETVAYTNDDGAFCMLLNPDNYLTDVKIYDRDNNLVDTQSLRFNYNLPNSGNNVPQSTNGECNPSTPAGNTRDNKGYFPIPDIAQYVLSDVTETAPPPNPAEVFAFASENLDLSSASISVLSSLVDETITRITVNNGATTFPVRILNSVCDKYAGIFDNFYTATKENGVLDITPKTNVGLSFADFTIGEDGISISLSVNNATFANDVVAKIITSETLPFPEEIASENILSAESAGESIDSESKRTYSFGKSKAKFFKIVLSPNSN